MRPRDRVARALTFSRPKLVPRDLWSLPGVGVFRPAELARMQEFFPSDFHDPGLEYRRGSFTGRASMRSARPGTAP